MSMCCRQFARSTLRGGHGRLSRQCPIELYASVDDATSRPNHMHDGHLLQNSIDGPPRNMGNSGVAARQPTHRAYGVTVKFWRSVVDNFGWFHRVAFSRADAREHIVWNLLHLQPVSPE